MFNIFKNKLYYIFEKMSYFIFYKYFMLIWKIWMISYIFIFKIIIIYFE